MENAEITIASADTTSLYLQDKAAIDSQVSTAKAFPRNMKTATENAIYVATIDQQTAATCTYSVPRAGKAITGKSVHLAKIIAQVWGNLRVEAKVVDIDSTTITCQAVAWDLESNVAFKVEVRRSIMTKNGRMSDDMIVVTGNAGNSIALRNAIFSTIPKGISDKVYNAALQTITGDISDENKMIKKRKSVIEKLINTYGVTEQEVISAVGKASIDHIGKEEIVVLIGIGTAIKDGDTTVDEAFRKKNTSSKAVKTQEDIENERIEVLIKESTTLSDLEIFGAGLTGNLLELYNAKHDELSGIKV